MSVSRGFWIKFINTKYLQTREPNLFWRISKQLKFITQNPKFMMKKLNIFMSILCFASSVAFAQWESINPGAGGQVQDIVCDPNDPDRVILASDMEGIYESINNGNSWYHKGNLKQNRVYAVAIPLGNADKMYVGTLYGLEVSNNGGNNFSLVAQSKKMSIGAITVDPNNQNTVIAGVGWRDDGGFAGNFQMQKNGPVVLYRSTNGGNSWTTINITNNQSSERNVYTIQFDKSNSNNVYVGTSQGVYKSTNAGVSWFPLNNNPGTNTGVAVSPNGKTLYGTFNHKLYTTEAGNINWQEKSANLPTANYWYPEVDPRSTGNSHKVILAVLGNRPGLFEGSFNTNGSGLVSSYSWKSIWSGQSGYDTGWDLANPNTRVAHYTPASWPRAIWSTSNQTIFQATPDNSTWGWDWNNKYSNKNTNFNVGGTSTYSSKGTASTYTFDVAVHKNYVIQGMADNGWMESWDSGTSWSNKQMRDKGNQSDVQSVAIGEANGKAIVISDAAPQCYGGICYSDARLWTKILSNTPSTSDQWNSVNGSQRSNNSTADKGKYRDIAVSPAKKNRVFAASNDYGLYMIDDLWSAANGGSNTMKLIWNNNIRVKKIAPHPTNANIIYLTVNGGNPSGGQGLYKGTSNNNGASWNFTKMNVAGSGWDSEVAVWMNGSQLYLFYYGYVNGVTKGVLSMNDGASWNTVFEKSDATGINTPNWFADAASDFRFNTKGGIAGYDNKIILNIYDHRQQLTYGVYRGTINGANSVSWEDWSGDIAFGGFTSGVIATPSDGNRYFYGSTAGAGLLRRQLSGGSSNIIPGSVAISGCPGSNLSIGGTVDLNETVSPSNATNKSVSWSSSNAAVATVNGSGVVTAVSAGSATITVTTNSGSRTATCGVTVNSNGGGGNSAVTVRARMLSGSSDQLEFRVNNATVKTWTISGSSYANYTASVAVNGNVKTYFPDNGTDIEIDYIIVDGTTYQAEAQAVNTGTWQNGSCGGSFDSKLFCSGHIDFGTITGSTPVIPTSVSISGCPGSNLAIGATANLNETVSPSNATNKNVTWTSSNNGVATVSNSGLVTAVSAGSATITVTTESGNETTTCSVTVNAATGGCTNTNLVSNAEFNSGLSDWSTYSGQNGSAATSSVVTNGGLSGTNSALINISNGGSAGSSDVQFWNNVSLVSGKTYEVIYQAKAASNRTMRVQLHQEGGGWTGYGEHTINLSSSVGNYSFEVTMSTTDNNVRLNFFLGGSNANVWIDGVVVREKCANAIIPSSVSISGCPGSNMTIGATANLNETVSPSNATNKNVTWSSSNNSVATVSNSGLVTAVAAGSATITVTTVSGNKTATCGVTVSAPACNNPTLVTNGEFNSGTSNWQLYVNTSANASFATVTGAGLSGTNSVKVTISNGASGDSDIQLYSNIGSLVNGKTYEVTFKAKAAGSRAIRVGVLKGSSPWTNYLTQNVNLTSSVQDYTLEFTMNENSNDARVDFFIGNNNNDVWVDAVAVKEKCTSGSRVGGANVRISDVKLYPNPMAAGQELTIDATELSQFNMQIISLEGRVIFEKQFSSVESSIKINISELNQTGIYLVKFNNGMKQWTQKLIVK